ncbi:uncharacterized [Tachysurus ichikawai]
MADSIYVLNSGKWSNLISIRTDYKLQPLMMLKKISEAVNAPWEKGKESWCTEQKSDIHLRRTSLIP